MASEAPVPSEENPASLSSTSATPPSESLPEWEPLTPELVEDEALRGDFVIRWAVVLLAVLLASSQINETATLVHIRSGELMTRGAILPSRGPDPFAATTTDRVWVNANWLFDIATSVIYSISSWTGLSLAKMVLAGVVFWLLTNIRIPRLPTWWGSVCALLAVVACHPRFTPTPELITLLGLALTLSCLWRWKLTGQVTLLRLLGVVFLVWTQLDERVFLGIWLLILFGVGESLTKGEKSVPGRSKTLWTNLVTCIILASIHPFPGAWWNAPWRLFRVSYPAFQSYSPPGGAGASVQYFPVASAEFFQNLHVSGICGLVLFGLAGVTLFLNRKRLELWQLLAFFGFALPAVLCAHELAAAALVFSVLATLNGQTWYANRFSLAYTVNARSLLLSRGGRAVTVLVLFGVALLAATGRLRSPGGGTLGIGLAPDLATTIDSYRTLLKETYGDNAFNFNLNQGDLLIWCGKKPFVDQRLALFSGTGERDLLDVHRKTRSALRRQRVQDGKTKETPYPWQEVFRKYRVTMALPRLTGTNPDYETLFDLLVDGRNWQLQRVGASTAVFCHGDLNERGYRDFLRKHRQDFDSDAFRKDVESAGPHSSWAQPPNFYEKFVWRTDRPFSPGAHEGQHLMRIATSIPSINPSLAYLAIRRTQQALANQGNDELAYLVLAEAYTYLGRFDTLQQDRPQGSNIEQMRYLQAVAAFNHALTINPENPGTRMALFSLYQRGKKVDLALRELEALYGILRRSNPNPDENAQKQLKNYEESLQKMRDEIKHVDDEVQPLVKKGEPAPRRAIVYSQHGCILRAIEAVAQDGELMSNPELIKLYGLWLLESGQSEKAYEFSGRLQGISEKIGYSDWRGLRTLCFLVNGEYEAAIQLWSDLSKDISRSGIAGMLAALSPHYNPDVTPTWPLTEINASLNYFYLVTDQIGSLNLSIALVSLEQGNTKRAGDLLAGILEQHPETPDRGTIAYYLRRIKGVNVDPYPPSERVPLLFAPESGSK